MTGQEIEKLREYCADFKKFRAITESGDGDSLHDIKNTFDYVCKTIEENNLVGTKFGEALSTKAREASDVLSELWSCLEKLEISIEGFCAEQERNNNSDILL